MPVSLKNMTELDYINLDSIELKLCSIVTNVVVTNVCFFYHGEDFSLSIPRGGIRSCHWCIALCVMNVYIFISHGCIAIIVCHKICCWRPKHFVSHVKSHLPLVTPSRQMKPAAVVFIWYGDQQRYRDSPVHFIRCMWKVIISKSSASAYTCTCSLWHWGFSAKDMNVFVGYFLRNCPLEFPAMKTTVNVDED